MAERSEARRREDSDSVPEYARVENAVRLFVKEEFRAQKDFQFVMQEILLNLMATRKEDVLAVMDYPRRGVYDIVYVDTLRYNIYLKELRLTEDKRMEGIKVIPHFPLNEQLVVIKMYSPLVAEEDIMTFLRNYCSSVQPKGKIRSEFGFWTSKWKFLVRFYINQKNEIVFPPGKFRLGKVNGDFFFSGMPDYCKTCRTYGHKRESCSEKECGICGQEGHVPRDCPDKKRCDLCLMMGHTFKECSRKKSNKKEEKGPEGSEKGKKDFEKEKRDSEEGKRESFPERRVIGKRVAESEPEMKMEEKLHRKFMPEVIEEVEEEEIEEDGEDEEEDEEEREKEVEVPQSKKVVKWSEVVNPPPVDLNEYKQRDLLEKEVMKIIDLVDLHELRRKVYYSFKEDKGRFMETYKIPSWLVTIVNLEWNGYYLSPTLLNYLIIYALKRGFAP